MKGLMYEGMLLKDKIRAYTVDNLKQFASEIGLSGYSKLKKDGLVAMICDYLLDPDVMFHRMSIFDDAALNIFEKGIEGFYQYKDAEYDTICTLNEINYVAVGGDSFYVFEDVAKAWKQIRNEKFEAYRRKASWIWKCLYWTEEMYGYTPIENFLDVVNTKKGIHVTDQELIKIFDHFPKDMLWTARINDIFVATIYLGNLDALKDLRTQQHGKPFYIPSVSEVEELYSTCALVSTPEYQEMLRFIADELGKPEDEAEDTLKDLWGKLADEDDPHETMQWFWNQFTFDGEKQVNKIVSLYMPLANNTRMKANRGHTPIELRKLMPSKTGTIYTITAGSTKAAAMLKEASPELAKLGLSVDLNSNAGTIPVIGMPEGVNGPVVTMQKKVYPNDPCPCGSGKKYKKCCGKNIS